MDTRRMTLMGIDRGRQQVCSTEISLENGRSSLGYGGHSVSVAPMFELEPSLGLDPICGMGSGPRQSAPRRTSAPGKRTSVQNPSPERPLSGEIPVDETSGRPSSVPLTDVLRRAALPRSTQSRFSRGGRRSWSRAYPLDRLVTLNVGLLGRGDTMS